VEYPLIPRHSPVLRRVASDLPGPVWPEAALASSMSGPKPPLTAWPKPRLLAEKVTVHRERAASSDGQPRPVLRCGME
jgi:hypothetical protein